MMITQAIISKELDRLHRQFKKLVAGGKHRTLEDFSAIAPGTYFVQISSPERLTDYMSDIIHKSDRAVLIFAKEYPGYYDWASDIYIKDCSVVQFKLK